MYNCDLQSARSPRSTTHFPQMIKGGLHTEQRVGLGSGHGFCSDWQKQFHYVENEVHLYEHCYFSHLIRCLSLPFFTYSPTLCLSSFLLFFPSAYLKSHVSFMLSPSFSLSFAQMIDTFGYFLKAHFGYFFGLRKNIWYQLHVPCIW